MTTFVKYMWAMRSTLGSSKAVNEYEISVESGKARSIRKAFPRSVNSNKRSNLLQHLMIMTRSHTAILLWTIKVVII